MIHIKDILREAKGRLITDGQDLEFNGISIDSRDIEEGCLFVPIKGENFDGHSFIEEALSSGAMGTLTSKEIDIDNIPGKCIIMVEDTLRALQDISEYFLRKAHIPVVGVTGSTGKTTTKELIYNVLAQKFKILKNKGNFNNHVGLPLSLLNIEEMHEMIVLEMGMSGRGEIDLLAKITKPEVGVITNIGICHIESLRSQEEIFRAKMELANYMNESSVLILNGDDDYLSGIKKKDTKYKRIFTGLKESNDIYAAEIKDLGDEGVEFTVNCDGKLYDFRLNVPGVHNVYNALLAIGVGRYYNISFDKIREGLNSFHGNKMRLKLMDIGNDIKLVNDCYNSNPDSMKAALDVLEGLNSKRKIAVLGDMLELGDYSEAAHREAGQMAFEKNIDVLITVGSCAENIAKGALEKGFPQDKVYALANNMTAANLLSIIKKSGDLILIKGSRGMKMEEIVQYLQERR